MLTFAHSEGNMKRSARLALGLVAAAMAGVAAPVATVSADKPTVMPPGQDQTLELPAGVACSDFGVEIVVIGGQDLKTFTDKNGNVVRTLSAGKGSTLTFTNLDTGESLTLRPNGSTTHTTINADGTFDVTATGHNVLVLFPSDVPAGPSTKLYVGQLRFNVDPATGVFTVTSFRGKTTDLCAALS